MSKLWTLIKCKWKWSVYQVGCVYYVIKYWRYWFQVCTIRLPHVFSSIDSVYFPASHVSAYAWPSREISCETKCLAVWLKKCLCFIVADHLHQPHGITLPLSKHAGLKFQWGLTSQLIFCAPQAIWQIPDRVIVQKILHKKCLLVLIK
jgi:hypothetical protein